MNGKMMEYANVKAVGVPADLNSAALVGAKVSLSENERAAIVMNFGGSTAANVVASFLQYEGANSKAINVTSYYHKVGAATKFTKVEITATNSVDLSALLGDVAGIVVFELEAQDLDVNGNFSEISVNLEDATAAKIFAGAYILGEPKFNPAYDREL